jgi:hypothetical protein
MNWLMERPWKKYCDHPPKRGDGVAGFAFGHLLQADLCDRAQAERSANGVCGISPLIFGGVPEILRGCASF